MAKKLQILRGTTAQNDAYTGSIGELTMDTEKVEVRIHDGTTQGGKTIGSGGGASLPILTHVFSDHKLNDISWLNADTFSWQSGDVYVAAYEHLASEVHIENLYAWEEEEGRNVYTKSATPSVGDSVYRKNGDLYGTVQSVGADNITVNGGNFPRKSEGDILGTNAGTDTVGGITITFYRAEDGHKICLADQESNVQALYEKTGVAWYYILDTENKRFKLPRTKHAFTGLRDSVGGYVEAGLPNITGKFNAYTYSSGGGSGAVTSVISSSNTLAGGSQSSYNFNYFSIDASRSSSVYGNSNTVQPEATQMYLYFYVGNFEQSALEQTAGITSEMFNGKADVSSVQALETRTGALEERDYVVASQMPSDNNNCTWYRKYKSGWVEQGVTTLISGGDAVVITLPVPMKTINYNISLSQYNGDTTAPNLNRLSFYNQNTTSFTVISRYTNSNVARQFLWKVCGIAA